MELEELIEKFKPRFWELIDETEKEEKEHGILIYERNGNYQLSQVEEGSRYSCIHGSCPQGWRKIEDFHTHLPSLEIPEKACLNLADAECAMIDRDKFFIIGSKAKGIRYLICFDFEVEHPDYKELSERANEYDFAGFRPELMERYPWKTLAEPTKKVRKWLEKITTEKLEERNAICAMGMFTEMLKKMVEKNLVHISLFSEKEGLTKVKPCIEEFGEYYYYLEPYLKAGGVSSKDIEIYADLHRLSWLQPYYEWGPDCCGSLTKDKKLHLQERKEKIKEYLEANGVSSKEIEIYLQPCNLEAKPKSIAEALRKMENRRVRTVKISQEEQFKRTEEEMFKRLKTQLDRFLGCIWDECEISRVQHMLSNPLRYREPLRRYFGTLQKKCEEEDIENLEELELNGEIIRIVDIKREK